MSSSPDSVSSRHYSCPDCGHEVGFRSRPRSITERYLLPLLLMRPVRCGHCFRRDYRLIFTPVRERMSDVPRNLPVRQAGTTTTRNVA
jgi:hypothetical protein